LGLAITRELLRLMGGHIEVESRPNLGSTFSFRLPCTQADEAAVIPFDTLPALARAKQPLHVLVAEDHPINMKLISLLLDQMGHTCAQAQNGEEALQLFNQQRFDLVLMDVMMPVMDGMTALRHVRQASGASRAGPGGASKLRRELAYPPLLPLASSTDAPPERPPSRMPDSTLGKFSIATGCHWYLSQTLFTNHELEKSRKHPIANLYSLFFQSLCLVNLPASNNRIIQITGSIKKEMIFESIKIIRTIQNEYRSWHIPIP
jgi:CheY-like chemotaxis protein